MMERLKNGGKGQLSFDMAFAILMVIIVTVVIVDHWTVSEATTNPGVKKAGLNVIADHVYSDISGLYNSLEGAGGKASLVVELPDELSFGEADNKYRLDYDLKLSHTPSATTIFLNESGGASVKRVLEVVTTCSSDSLFGTAAKAGNKLELLGCTNNGNLDCDECKVT